MINLHETYVAELGFEIAIQDLQTDALSIAKMAFQLETSQSAFYVNLYRAVIGPSG